MTTREQMQIYQTVSVRLKEGKKGPPDSFTEEQKEWYRKMEKSTLEDQKAGRIVNYSWPNDYDWEDGIFGDDFDYSALKKW